MPHFYFDVHDGQDIIDEDGTICADLDEARREAVKASGELLRDRRELWNGEIWTMKVRDEHQDVVATLTFSAT